MSPKCPDTPLTNESELREYHSNPEAPAVVYADFARDLEREAARWKKAAELWDCSTPEELERRIHSLPETY